MFLYQNPTLLTKWTLEFYFQIMKSLRFCKIEKTDRVPAAHAVRLVLPLQGNVNEV